MRFEISKEKYSSRTKRAVCKQIVRIEHRGYSQIWLHRGSWTENVAILSSCVLIYLQNNEIEKLRDRFSNEQYENVKVYEK